MVIRELNTDGTELLKDFIYEEIKKLHNQIYPYNNFLY